MSTLILLIAVSLAGFAAGLLVEWRIRKAFDKAKELLTTEKKRNTGVVRLGVGSKPSTRYDGDKSAIVRPKPPKPENAEREAALASARSRAGVK